jgi:hypothetical protein
MERRSFLRSLIGGVAAAAAVRTFPFRIYSFPGEIAIPKLLFNLGDIIEFEGVFQINPLTRRGLPILKKFVIVENVYSHLGSEKPLPISPYILQSGPYQNCKAPSSFEPVLKLAKRLSFPPQETQATGIWK